jgi:quercetin dioxygenase-like cupin family protein
MFTRRGFAGCALCVVTGFTATGVEAQNAPAGLKRTIITRTDGPMQGYETVNARVDLEAGALVARHTHPGIESSYVVDGALELSVDGQGTRTLKAADGFQVPPRAPHSAKNGDKPTILAITYVVEKGKPLASPA